MKTINRLYFSLLILVTSIFFQHNANAIMELENCFKSRLAEYYIQDLESISANNETPILLFNDAKEVVGFISVSPKRSKKEPFNAESISFNTVYICSETDVTEFFYIDSPFEEFLNWRSSQRIIEITNDEGMLLLKVELFEQGKVADIMKLSYRAYDVFGDENTNPKIVKHPDYLEGFGLPKVKGVVTLYLPKTWEKIREIK